MAHVFPPGRSLPEDFEEAHCHFSHLIREAAKAPLEKFRAGIVASPPLRKHFFRLPQNIDSLEIQVLPKFNSTAGDPLLWLLGQLNDPDQVFLCGLPNLLDELERLIRSDRKQRERISSWIASLISDIAVLGELQHQIDLSSLGPQEVSFVPQAALEAKSAMKTASIARITAAISGGMEVADLGTPLKRCNYPSDRRPILATNLEMRRAEGDPEQFWQQFDKHYENRSDRTLHGLLKIVIKHHELRRTCEWSGPDPVVEILEDPSSGEPATYISTASLEKRTERTLVAADLPAQPKIKPKTRGIAAAPAPSDDHDQEEDSPQAASPPTLLVGNRDYKAFSTLFRPPTEDGVPGELPWAKFPYAMTYSRRLESAYGWTAEIFIRV